MNIVGAIFMIAMALFVVVMVLVILPGMLFVTVIDVLKEVREIRKKK